MKKNIPLTIESITDADEKECRIVSTKQIQSILRNIAESGTNAALYYNAKREFIMTTILDLDEDGLWVEPGHSSTENHHIGESRKITLVSSHNQVKVQFFVNNASLVTYDKQPALFLPMPTSIYRFQRREYFRLSLSTAEHLRCLINVKKARGESLEENVAPLEASVVEVEIPAADISGGGIGLVCMEGDFDFVPGETYTDCQIDLPNIGLIHVSITIKNLIPISKHKSGKMLQRAGCEFRDIDGQTAGKLQRFITDKQRLMAMNGLTA
ncbi:MAG TPA: flagellar regulator YcgR PilZN domain-containing protein [Gallionella sp.]|nr:flagellar regulator YcgR PilZN domain-containing protein [Gallionella sp.]